MWWVTSWTWSWWPNFYTKYEKNWTSCIIWLKFCWNKNVACYEILNLWSPFTKDRPPMDSIFIPRAIKKRPAQHTKRIIDRKKEKKFGINAFLHFLLSRVLLPCVGKSDFNEGNILVYCNVIRSLVMIWKTSIRPPIESDGIESLK